MFEKKTRYRMSLQTRKLLDTYKLEAEIYLYALSGKMLRFNAPRIADGEMLDFLEFSDDFEFYDAFVVPDATDSMTLVGKDGKAVRSLYLIEQWTAGKDAGIFKKSAEGSFPHVWKLEPSARHETRARWRQDTIN